VVQNLGPWGSCVCDECVNELVVIDAEAGDDPPFQKKKMFPWKSTGSIL
jgi:hypothetical protein